ncbi:MAG: hypothetical protein HC769_26590 [Cyanobacteria bacterium CRU_2_1]|nr:hypothetical protein [Cyanobacteria bacterium RU_5_0]NJR62080.1 hypothetical protein [Cyanobacteria bacterium CRU_2_1]
MDHLYWLDQIQPSQRDQVGDKAFYLSLLTQRGYPVIPGFVVPAIAFESFLEQIIWAEPMFADLPNSSLHIDVDNPRQLQAVAQQIRQAIRSTALSKAWLTSLKAAIQQWQTSTLILRPSFSLPAGSDPTISHRTIGLLESQVCWAGEEAIAHSLKQVWAELFRAKSMVYWQRLGIQLQQINLAVLVQPIQSTIASGDVRSHPPYLEVRATWGLGKALVNGEVMPDRYHIHLPTEARSHHPGNQTHAYRMATTTFPLAEFTELTQTDCFQSYAIEDAHHAQSVLTHDQLRKLIDLTRQAAADVGTTLELEWILMQPKDAQPGLYLTQAIPQWITSPLKPPSVVTPAHLTGLAAAPGRVIAQAWVIDRTVPTAKIPANVILVAPHITPDWLLSIKQIAGVITEQGGMTSHGAILARELHIPAVTGILNVTHLIQTGDSLLVDGDRGEVHRVDMEKKSQASSVSHQQPSDGNQPPDKPLLPPPSSLIPASSPPIATQLFVTLSRPEGLDQAVQLPVDGVGLLRSELMMLEALERRHPSLWLDQQDELIHRMAHRILPFARTFAPRPVFYRSLDLRSHEFPTLEGSPPIPEANPMLGLRGTFSYQMNPALFGIELAALKQIQQWGQTHVHLLLPFVRTVEEFRFCRDRVEQAGLLQNPHFQLWIMAEVPSILPLLPDYIQAGVQGISIGSNDLTQLLLGVDRDHPQMAAAFDQHHPAVMRTIQQIIQTARHAGIPCCLCGQAPSRHPEMIDALVRWGVTGISVAPGDVEWVYGAIARAEQRLLLEAARHSRL